MQTECTRKVLVFECADGIDRTYDVHDDVFDLLEEGDDGMLYLPGRPLHRFRGQPTTNRL